LKAKKIMGGFTIKAQPFGVYQAIEWLSISDRVSNQVNAARRIRKMVENGSAEDMMKLNVVSRLVELLEKSKVVIVQVTKKNSPPKSFETQRETSNSRKLYAR
jgi:hypothetical protein